VTVAFGLAVMTGAVAPAAAEARPEGAPTFTRDVAPIFYKRCISCHRPGEMAPMSLLSYREARPYARSIRARVEAATMPPWHAEAKPGTFLNERQLTASERDTIVQWVAGGAPEGDSRDLPPAPSFPDGWTIGKPDLVLSMPEAFDVPAQGTIPYQDVVIPTPFTEDTWVRALELRAGVPSVVHHILVFGREPGTGSPHAFSQKPLPKGGNHGVEPPQRQLGEGLRPPQAGQPRGGQPPTRRVLLATLAPGTSSFVFPEGTAMKIKAGTTLEFQLHYTANGSAASDRSSIGFVLANEPPEREMRVSHFMNPLLYLPAGAANQRVDTLIEFTADARIWAIFPHTHLRGKAWEYRLHHPEGRSEVVLSVPNYDFNWQTYYQFARPLEAPKGARLEAIAYYDNSAANRANPDPTMDVRWGEQTWEEMQYTGISYTVD
jgi:mono/diheme cytochrome c family protein